MPTGLVLGLALGAQPVCAGTFENAAPISGPDLASAAATDAAGLALDRSSPETDRTNIGQSLIPGIGDWALPSQSGEPAMLSQAAAALEPTDGSAPKDEPAIPCIADCPPPQLPAGWADHVPGESARKPGFWKQAGKVKYETAAVFAYFTANAINKLGKPTRPFHFKDEGWFGKDTANLGVDKMAHAFNTYLIAELLHRALHHKTGASQGDALTASLLAFGLVAYNELNDGIEADGGFSMNDMAMNLAGAGFSLLRNTVPGLKEKVAFKLEIVPNNNFITRAGKEHYKQQRFFLALQGSGFEGLKRSPLRYLDLQVGYYASGFTNRDRAAGREPKRHLFVGVGLNLGAILFGNSNSGLSKAGRGIFDYWQPPYTSARIDSSGRADW